MSHPIDLLTLEVLLANATDTMVVWGARGENGTRYHLRCIKDHSGLRRAVERYVLSYASEEEKLKGCWHCDHYYKV